MKLVLMGTNAFVVPIFDAIKNAGHEIMAVFTRAPKPMGRKQVLTPSPVHNWAVENGLNLHTNINEYDYLQYNKLFSPVFQDFALYNISGNLYNVCVPKIISPV